jgi:sugar lactone lactonase YvrE
LPTSLVTQIEDVVVDRRGYIYCTDKNHGLFVLRYGPGLK